MRTPTRQTQDWQLEAYEMRGRHNSVMRHQRTIDEMERSTPTWGRNINSFKMNWKNISYLCLSQPI